MGSARSVRRPRRCGICGRERVITRAARGGDPDMCQPCWSRDERSWKVCARCGRLRPAKARDHENGGPLCERCYRHARVPGVCEGCGREVVLVRTGARGASKICARCAAPAHPRRACGRCGKVAQIALRVAPDGTRDVCYSCYRREPLRVCGACGKRAAIHRRGTNGEPDLCGACYRLPRARCSGCGHEKPCYYANSDAPLCYACKPRRMAPCTLCGQERVVAASSPLGPLCRRCQWRTLRAKATCERCGKLRRPALHTGDEILCGECAGVPQRQVCRACGIEDVNYQDRLCSRCWLTERLVSLRAEGEPAAIERLEPYLRTLTKTPDARSTINWLRRKRGGRTLIDLTRGHVELSHEGLDQLDRGRSTEHLRAALVHAGILPQRDELLVAFERWTTTQLQAVAPGEDHATLRRFATWKIGRELAERHRRRPGPAQLSATMPKRRITHAIALTLWLHRQGFTLAALDQLLLDQWLANGTRERRNVSQFVRWLERERITRGLTVPAQAQPTSAVPALADHDRLRVLRRLLTDEQLEAPLQLAAALVALYAQPVARIVRLTTADIIPAEDGPRLRLGGDPVPLPASLHASVTAMHRDAAGTPRWLFPGQKAGQPRHPGMLARRLTRLGLPVAAGRASALEALTHKVPAPVLADLLGMSNQTTARASGRLKVDYAAYIARRITTDASNR